MQQRFGLCELMTCLQLTKWSRKEFQWAFLIICYKKQTVALRINFFLSFIFHSQHKHTLKKKACFLSSKSFQIKQMWSCSL